MTSATPNQPLLHSIPEACALLGNIGRTLFYDLVAAGRIKLVHQGRRSFVAGGELRRYADSLSDEGAATPENVKPTAATTHGAEHPAEAEAAQRDNAA